MSYQPEHDLRPDHVLRWNVVADTELTIVWAERFCRLPLDSSGSLCGRTAPFSKVENLRTHVRRHITQDPAFFGTFRIKDRGNPGRLNMKEKRDGRL